MTMFGTKNGWRGIPLIAETTVGTKQTTGFKKLNFEDSPFLVNPVNIVNDNEKTGQNDATIANIISKQGNGQHSQKLLSQHIGLMALAMGECDNTDLTGAHSHAVKPGDAIALKTFTLLEHDGRVENSFAGCAVKGFTISGNREDFCQFQADLISIGKKESTSIGKAAVTALGQSYLRFGDVTINIGGTVTGVDSITGGTAFSADLIDFSYAFDNNARVIYPAGNGNDYGTEITRGNYSHSLSVRFDVRGADHITNLDADAYVVFSIPIVGSVIGATAYNYAIKMLFPRVKYSELSFDSEDGKLVASINTNVLNPDNDTYEAVHIVGYDAQETYLA